MLKKQFLLLNLILLTERIAIHILHCQKYSLINQILHIKKRGFTSDKFFYQTCLHWSSILCEMNDSISRITGILRIIEQAFI